MGNHQREWDSEKVSICAVFAHFVSDSDSSGGGACPPNSILRGSVTWFHQSEWRSSNVSLFTAWVPTSISSTGLCSNPLEEWPPNKGESLSVGRGALKTLHLLRRDDNRRPTHTTARKDKVYASQSINTAERVNNRDEKRDRKKIVKKTEIRRKINRRLVPCGLS